MSIRVLNGFIGYSPDVESESETEFEFVEKSILSLALLHFFISSVVTFHLSDEQKWLEVIVKKDYRDTFP